MQCLWGFWGSAFGDFGDLGAFPLRGGESGTSVWGADSRIGTRLCHAGTVVKVMGLSHNPSSLVPPNVHNLIAGPSFL